MYILSHVALLTCAGTLLVNDEPPYFGEAPGRFVGMDIEKPLYIGGVPNYEEVPRAAGFTSGFVGKFCSVTLGADKFCWYNLLSLLRQTALLIALLVVKALHYLLIYFVLHEKQFRDRVIAKSRRVLVVVVSAILFYCFIEVC